MNSGENRAWGLLAESEPVGVCARAAVEFDFESSAYRIVSFGRVFSVNPVERLFLSLDPEGEALLKNITHYFRLTVLWYLAKAASTFPGGRLVKPSALSGGQIFTRGTHVLPLDALAAKYATRPSAFLEAGAALGGRKAPYGDAAIELPALPKVPVTILLWTENDEFPARADLLFDATAPQHLPPDVLWSVAMLSVLTLL